MFRKKLIEEIEKYLSDEYIEETEPRLSVLLNRRNQLVMKQRKLNIQIIFIALLGLCLAACGKQADTDYETVPEQRMEDMAESENIIKEDEAITEDLSDEEKAADTVKEASAIAADEQEAEQLETDDVITTYITEDIEYSDEAAPVQYVDDLSLIEG